MPLEVGIDLVSVAEVETALGAHGERYLARVFTDRERADCNGSPRRLAARFAVKEATMKALRTVDGGIGWRSIELVATDDRPMIRLSGEAERLAASQGVTGLSVDLVCRRERAAAIVVAEAEAER